MKTSFSFLLILFLVACSERSTNSLSKKTMEIFDEGALLTNLDSLVVHSLKEYLKEKGYESNIILNVDLMHKEGNEYAGAIELDIQENNLIPIEVTYDGTSFMWKIEAGYTILLFSESKKYRDNNIIRENFLEQEIIDSESQKFLEQIQK